MTLTFKVVLPFLSPLIFNLVADLLDLILANFVLVYLLFTPLALPVIFTVTVLPFLTETLFLLNFGEVVTLTL